MKKFPHFGSVLALQLVIILAEFMEGGTFCNESTPKEHLRISRSIKETFLKDQQFSQDRAIMDMHKKVSKLESTVKNISEQVSSVDTKMQTISEQASRFDQSFALQAEIMQQLNGEVASLKQILSGHGEILGDLEKMASSDDNIFAMSNNTCGEVLIGQSGSIHFSGSALSEMGSSVPLPSTCVWTVRANNRRNVKFQTFPPSTMHAQLYGVGSSLTSPDAYLVEIRSKKSDANDTSRYSAPNLQTKLTKLEKNMRYVCNGPVVFVVYMVNTDSSDQPLELHFEGTGKFIKESVLYSHEIRLENSGSFDSEQMVTDDLLHSNVTYSMDYSSILISNYSTRVYLHASIENQACQDKDTNFVVVTNLLESKNAAFVDCCSQSCVGNQSLVNYDSPFLILITKQHHASVKFNLSWEAETPYPSISNSGSLYKCGGVLGGSRGSISYKPRLPYRNNERCIWTIVPQPRPQTQITIEMYSNGVESAYDHLYMMELTDVNGTALTNAPKITHLRAYGTYIAYGREVYIVFYSDSTIPGEGFSLSWKARGDFVRTGMEVSMKFAILTTETGSMASLQERSSLTRGNLYQVFMLLPHVSSTSTYGIQLSINQTQPTPGLLEGDDCLDKSITVYNTYNGLFRKADMDRSCTATNGSTSPQSQVKAQIPDGIAMIVLNDTSSLDTPPMAINFTWKEEYGEESTDDDLITINNNQCGGVIKADKGVLNYKLADTYFNNERCVWLLQTPNHTRITLKLLKEGFEFCCDKILVNTIDPTNGTLSTETWAIDRVNNTQTYNESVVVIVFRSDGSSRGRGFSLQFTGEGSAPEETPEYSYQFRHHNEPVGAVSYPDSEWDDPVSGTKEILVTAFSYKMLSEDDSSGMSTNVTLTSGIFKRERGGGSENENCTYESITFYTSPYQGFWMGVMVFPKVEDKATCPTEVVMSNSANVFQTVSGAFLAIYRRVPSLSPIVTENGGENGTSVGLMGSMRFTFRKSSTCGGVYIGDSGVIKYKEGKTYLNSERCVWLVEAPQAEKIRFSLERSGFEQDCDFVYVTTINKSGSPAHTTLLQAGSTSTATVDGPVVIVVFTSDSSVSGTGFRLRYTTTVTAASPFPYTFLLDHQEGRTTRFNFQVEANQLAIAAFSMEPDRYSTTLKTQVNVTALRTQVDEKCNSDRLTLYDVRGNVNGPLYVRSMSALSVLKNESLVRFNNESTSGHCSPLGNGDFGNCTRSISDCVDEPNENSVDMTYTPFVVVYKSANVSTGDLQYRGFAMTSKRTAITTSTRLYG